MNQPQTQPIAKKLLDIQRKIAAVTKSATNPHFRSKYADLNEVLSTAKPLLNENGVIIVQAPGADSFGKYVETSLVDYESGQQVAGKVYFSGNEDNMQKLGAAITYARRFGIVSLLALESEDDDGETAVGRGQAPTKEVPVSSKGAVTSPGVAGVSGEPKAPVSRAPSKDQLIKKIGLTSKVLVDSKRMPQEDVVKMLQVYGVKAKEELNQDQATKLLAQLEERLK